MSKKDSKSKNWFIGIDEASEKVWVKNAGSFLQDFLKFSLKIQEVDSFCKKTFARVRYDLSHIARLSEKLCFQKVDSSCRECLVFLERPKEIATSCTVPVRKGAICKYEKKI